LRIGRARIADRVSARNREARCVEPVAKPGLRRAADHRIAAGHDIGALAPAGGAGGPGCGQSERVAVLEGSNSAHAPATHYSLFEAIAAAQEFMARAEREIDRIAHNQALAR